MPLKPTGKTDDVFASELKKKLEANASKAKISLNVCGDTVDEIMASVKENLSKMLSPVEAAKTNEVDKSQETKLDEHREEKGQEASTEGQEKSLANDPVANRKEDPKEETTEGQLRKHKTKHAPNADKEGVTEQRLNEASKELYPHRNPQAYERTGDKRPVNALPEELGRNSDEAKRERYEKANKSAFNMKKTKTAAITKSFPAYIEYREAGVGPKFAELRNVDGVMESIMSTASTEERDLTQDEIAQIDALKRRKTELLQNKG
jgi:hypothetical protein